MKVANWLNISIFPLLGLFQIINAQRIPKRNSQFDVTSPMVFKDSFSSLASNSLFGWSVTLVQSGSGTAPSSWVFIGDPKGDSTDPSYKTSNIKEPGVVWRCSLTRSGIGNKCEIMNLDPQLESRRGNNCTYLSCEDFPQYEFKSDGWVGGTLLSNSDRFVACGPRWSRGSDENPFLNGLCYWFEKNKMYKTWRPDMNDLQIDPTKYNHRLIPLFEKQRNNVRDHQSFNLPNGEGSVYDWGLGQFGMSAHLGENQLIVGAPGLRLFTGSVIIYVDSGAQLRNSMPRKNKVRETQFNYFNIVYREPIDFGYIPEHYYDYFGYSVTSGKYFGNGETFYAAGSPRARGGGIISGEVVIFKTPSLGWVLTSHQILLGAEELFGAYFGSVLLSVDTNNDGIDELFVAAPLCNTQSASVNKINAEQESGNKTSAIVGDQGCVFVYTNSYSNPRQLVQYTQLSGSGAPGARFGSAMVSLGDLNEDGYIDIAIGAPFEDNGQGAVYIFYGSKSIPANWRSQDRIAPSSFNMLSIKGFGSSLSTVQDIDNNDTPDLAIGSFLSRNVVILRSRPVVTLSGLIGFMHATTREIINFVPNNVTKFQVYSCVSYSGKRVNPTLRLRVTISLDRNFGRFAIPESTFYEDEVFADQSTCKTFNARQVKPFSDGNQPIVAPIRLEQLIQYTGATNFENVGHIQNFEIVKPRGGGSAEPVLNTNGNANLDSFCPKCPFPDDSQSSKDLQVAPECKDPNKCIPKLNAQVAFESAEGKQIQSAVINWGTKFSIAVSITNNGEPAYNPEIGLSWKSNAEFQNPVILDQSLPLGCKESEKGSYNCTNLNPIKMNKPTHFKLQFSLSEIYATEQEQTLIFVVKVRAGDQITEGNSALALTADSRVKISGTKITQGISMADRFTQSFRVDLEGQSPVESISTEFYLPTQFRNDKVLMVAKPKGNVDCRAENGDFSELPEQTQVTKPEEKPSSETEAPPGVNFATVIQSRKRRQVQENTDTKTSISSGTEMPISSPNENTTVLQCSDNEVQCMKIICTLNRVYVQSMTLNLISFEMLVIPENTVQLLDGKDKLLVQSEGTAKILSGTQAGHIAKDISQSTILKFQNLGGQETPLWIYVVSGVGGLILLFLIIICLRATGFFRRKKMEELNELKARAEVQDHLQAANNVPNFENLGDDQSMQ